IELRSSRKYVLKLTSHIKHTKTEYGNSKNFRSFHYYGSSRNRWLLSALSMAQARSVDLVADSRSNQPGCFCLVAHAASSCCGACLCSLWRSLRQRCSNVAVGRGFGSTNPH